MKKILFVMALFALVKINAQTPDFKKNYEDGNIKYKAKSFSLAILSYDKAIAIVQTEADNAIKAKTALSEDKKYISDVYARRATCYYHTGNYSAMKTDDERVLLLEPNNMDALATLAYLKYKAGDKKGGCSAAREQISRGSEVASRVFEDCFCWSVGYALYKEGVTQANLKRYDTALVMLNKALAIIPDSGSIYAERAKVYLEKNEPEKALADLYTAIAKKTNSYKVYYLRAQVYIKADKLDSAFEDLNTCLDLKKDYYDGYILRAELDEKQEKWNNAIFDYNLLIKMRPDFGMNYYKIALVKHNNLNDLLGACEMYTAAANRGVEEAKEMAANCANPKYMKKTLQKAEK
ncbi:MAG: tetratricopeptide repeat protein [Bacteroidia bacterium]